MEEIRRVVTGHDPQGRSVVLSDAPVARVPATPGASFFWLWRTVATPVDNDDPADRAADPPALTQPGGSVLVFADLAPGARSPLHRTTSLDYALVLAGPVDLELDDGSTTRLETGAVVVQRGTMHAWVNPGPHTARMAYVLLDAAEPTANGERLPAYFPG